MYWCIIRGSDMLTARFARTLPINSAGVGGNGNTDCISRWRPNLKRKKYPSPHHGPRPIPIICHYLNSPYFSFVTTFKFLKGEQDVYCNCYKAFGHLKFSHCLCDRLNHFSYLIRKSSKKNFKNIFALLFLIIY